MSSNTPPRCSHRQSCGIQLYLKIRFWSCLRCRKTSGSCFCTSQVGIVGLGTSFLLVLILRGNSSCHIPCSASPWRRPLAFSTPLLASRCNKGPESRQHLHMPFCLISSSWISLLWIPSIVNQSLINCAGFVIKLTVALSVSHWRF
jgi:hypothetical protein